MKQKTYKLLVIVLTVIVVVAVFEIISDRVQRQKEQDELEQLASLSTTQAPPVPDDPVPDAEMIGSLSCTDSVAAPTDTPAQNLHDISTLQAQNPDCIGWVRIPGTIIDYPVMHTPQEPERYLRKNFYGSYSHSGVPFLDHRCSLSSTNMIIYGHNMRSSEMFSTLTKYMDGAYRDMRPTIELETVDGMRNFDIFCVASVGENDAWYSFIDAADDAMYDKAISDLAQASIYSLALPRYGEKLLTLSTCSGSGRIVVVAAEKDNANDWQ